MKTIKSGRKFLEFFILSIVTYFLMFPVIKANAQVKKVEAFDSSQFIDPDKFADPPHGYRQQAWLTYNLSRATKESLTKSIEQWAQRDLTGGFYLGMGGGNTSDLSEAFLNGSGLKRTNEGVKFLSPEYFELYETAIKAGLKNGNPPIVFYDEVGYPSGIAGGLLYSKYPEYTAKSLEKIEEDISGPKPTIITFPEDGMILGAVRMNLDNRELVDVSDEITNRQLNCTVPEGHWKVMGFYLDPKASLGQGRKSGYVDYLDKKAVQTYISLVYQSHYDHLKPYFGNVLQITHFDEPAMHVTRGRAWTPKFNEEFQAEYGYNPMKYYPALWYDIGPETKAIRNALWGFRAKLFSENYIKQLDDWCRAHNIMLSGHFDQEEIDNPVPVNGDLMQMFKYEQVPGIDDIWWWGRTNRGYKIVSSAAYNWDKPFLMAETYAAYRENMSPEIVYKVAMDQAAMGVNFQVGALPRDKTPESDRFIGRLSYMLQHGKHVADIAILYPIASLQADYHFANWMEENVNGDLNGPRKSKAEVAYAREGGMVSQATDYIDLGETIFRGLRQDFTFLHPDVLQKRCIIEGNQLVLDNKINRETYSVLVLPDCSTISVETARKLKAFYDAGGTLIATKRLANRSKEQGENAEVKNVIGEIFGLPEDKPWTAAFNRRIDEFNVFFVNRNEAGGRAYFMPDYTPEMIQTIMQEAIPVPDVKIEEPIWPVVLGRKYNGSLTYIHKIKDNRNIYFFANSSNKKVDTTVNLRGSVDVSVWNPMTGKIEPMDETHSTDKDGSAITMVKLNLEPASALFYVENK